MDFQRIGERMCFIALGWELATTVESHELSTSLVALYAAVAVAILAARWVVVSRRERHDRERAASLGEP